MFSVEHDSNAARTAAQAAANWRWVARLDRWSRRLHLHGMLTALLDAAEPLGPVGAQFLWVAQPVLGLFTPRHEIDALARLLDAPGGVAWLHAQLDDPDTVGEHTAIRAPQDTALDTIGDENP